MYIFRSHFGSSGCISNSLGCAKWASAPCAPQLCSAEGLPMMLQMMPVLVMPAQAEAATYCEQAWQKLQQNLLGHSAEIRNPTELSASATSFVQAFQQLQHWIARVEALEARLGPSGSGREEVTEQEASKHSSSSEPSERERENFLRDNRLPQLDIR